MSQYALKELQPARSQIFVFPFKKGFIELLVDSCSSNYLFES